MSWFDDLLGRKSAEQAALERRMARFDAARQQEEKEKPRRRAQSETTALWWARFKDD